jgi:hypothetical protein
MPEKQPTAEECHCESQRRYYQNHREEILQWHKNHYEGNREAIREAQRQYRQKHRETLLEHKRRYYQEHREEIRQKNRRDYEEHQEERKQKQKKYFQENRAKALACNRQYYQKNRTKWIANVKTWRKTNLEGNRINRRVEQSIIRAKKHQVTGRFKVKDIKELLELQQEKCAVCQKSFLPAGTPNRYHVDHILSMSKGGLNTRENIQLLCPSCNRRKH